MAKMRLDKLLAHMGFGTRKELKTLGKQGVVSVNGQVVRDMSQHVNAETDEIVVAGTQVLYREFIYLMLNKPAGVISATEDNRWTTVIDLLEEGYKSFSPFPVGRLDRDTEGLLILTNDGALAHSLLSPKKHVPKTYFARLEQEITVQDIAAFEKGVVLDDGYKTLPAKLEALNDVSSRQVLITIHEGKFHQVKRMFETVGNKVLYLKRLSMGNLQLDENLLPGQYRELTPAEVERLRFQG